MLRSRSIKYKRRAGGQIQERGMKVVVPTYHRQTQPASSSSANASFSPILIDFKHRQRGPKSKKVSCCVRRVSSKVKRRD